MDNLQKIFVISLGLVICCGTLSLASAQSGGNQSSNQKLNNTSNFPRPNPENGTSPQVAKDIKNIIVSI
jgi:hypothetical protein